MLKNDIRGRFTKNLLGGSVQKKRKEFKLIDDVLFPVEKGFKEFLLKSKEEQTEISKYLLCDIGFSTFASPPNVYIRNLLSLQAKEKYENKNEKYYPRDHVIHKIYLYLLGIYMYTYSDLFFTKINNKLSILKRKYDLLTKDNFSLFASLWKHFALFHDIGYPVERLSNQNIKEFINSEIIVDIKNIRECYLDELVLKSISNLVVIATITSEKERFSFKSQIFDHIIENDRAELRKQIPGGSFDKLLNSKPYVNITSLKLARLVGVLVGENNIITAVEDAVTGEILIVCSLDSTIKIKLSPCKSFDKTYNDIFEGPNVNSKYLLKFYLLDFECSAINTLTKQYGEEFSTNLLAVHSELEQNKLYDTYKSDGENISEKLNFIAYSIITSDKFVDYSTKDRFNKKDFIDIIEDALKNIEGKFPEMIGKQVSSAILKRIKNRTYDFNLLIKTSNQSEIYKNIILSAFDIDNIKTKSIKDVSKKIKEGEIFSKANIDRFKVVLNETIDRNISKSDFFEDLTANIKSEIDPLVKSKLRTSNAISGLFAKLKPTIAEAISKSLENCLVFELIRNCDFKEFAELQRIFIASLDSIVLSKISSDYKELYKEIVLNYNPEWGVDHGFFSALVYLGNLELVYYISTQINSGELNEADSKIMDLIFFNGQKMDYKSLGNEVLLCGEICFRSILLHNFYPKKVEKFSKFSHDINSNPFTYFSVLCDGLQDWGREVQYNQGVKDYKGFKPDNFYDIEISAAKIKVIISKDYCDDNTLSNLKSGMSEYLKNLNSFVNFESR